MQAQTLAGRALRAPDRATLASAPRRWRSPRTPCAPVASLNAFVGLSPFDSGSSTALMTQVATGAAWVAAAWLGLQVVMQQVRALPLRSQQPWVGPMSSLYATWRLLSSACAAHMPPP